MPSLLLDQREQQVLRQDLGMPLAIGELLRGEDRFLRFLGVLVDVHGQLRSSSSQLQLAARALACATFQFRQRLVVLPLLLRQRAGKLDVHRRVQIPAFVRLADGRHAVSLEAEHLAALRGFRNLEPHRSGDRRDLRLAAEHRRRDRHARPSRAGRRPCARTPDAA